MLSNFCLLVFVVSNAVARTTFKDLCSQTGCGDYKLLEGNGTKSKIYYLNDDDCGTFTIRVSEDEKNVTFDFGGDDTTVYNIQKDGCAVRTSLKEDRIERELFVKLPGTCDEVFVDLTCFDDGDYYVYLISRGAPTDCVKDAAKVLKRKYCQSVAPGFGETTCT